jgi:hypothetical protein
LVLDIVSKTTENNYYDFIYGNIITKNGHQILDGIFSREKLVTQRNICHQAIFYKKKLFDLLGMYNLEFKILSDWDFNVRCFSFPEIKHTHIDRIIAIYEDIDGFSKNNEEEVNFTKLLPHYYIAQNALMKSELLVGKVLLFPLRLIQKMINK